MHGRMYKKTVYGYLKKTFMELRAAWLEMDRMGCPTTTTS